MHPTPEAPRKRPLPTVHINATERSRIMAEHDLGPDDFDAVRVPLGRVSDAERVRVTAWAARHSGPKPTHVTLFKVKAKHLPPQTADLFASPEASTPEAV